MANWLRGYDIGAERTMLEREGDDKRIGRRITPLPPDDLSAQAVYFVQAIGANLVKIGWVKDVRRWDTRLALLERDCPYPVKLLHLQHGASRSDEWRAHKVFETERFHGEWFRIEGDLKLFLQMCAVAEARASAVLLAAICEKGLTSNL